MKRLESDRGLQCALLAYSRRLLAWDLSPRVGRGPEPSLDDGPVREAGGTAAGDAPYEGSGAKVEDRPGAEPRRSAILNMTPGLFVTLRLEGRLRGCIGRITTDDPLRETLPRVTRDAAFRDRRFDPVRSDELDQITIEHSILTIPAPVAGPEAIRIGTDGVILGARGRRAVFLPEVATEQGWDVATMLSALSRKAGLPLDAWRDPATAFETFQTIHYGEEGCR